jgi:hypothetical protein
MRGWTTITAERHLMVAATTVVEDYFYCANLPKLNGRVTLPSQGDDTDLDIGTEADP